MKVKDFLVPKAVTIDLKATNKEGVIKELLSLLAKAGAVEDEDKLFKVLMNRESLGSTGIGQGVGIPHGKSDTVSKLIGAFGTSRSGVDFDSLDGEPTHIFFLLIAPEDSAGPHLKALAKISRLLKDKFLRDSLLKTKSPKEAIDILTKEE